MSNAPTASTIRVDLGAIFVSLELSQSKWLVTSLTPGGGEKMSKHLARAFPGAALLLGLKEIGADAAAVLWGEGLCRHFDNRRQVAAYAGLAPTPWQSGQVDHEQGVSKSGNPRLRTTLIQIAWLWLRHQPDTALTLWFKDQVARNGGRLKKTMIVAVARKLFVALWKYTRAGVVIEGAVLKAD